MRLMIISLLFSLPLLVPGVVQAQCCPLVTVVPSVKTVSKISKPLTFTAMLTKPAATAADKWKLTDATVGSGQGTHTITIDPTTLPGDSGTIRAEVSVQAAG